MKDLLVIALGFLLVLAGCKEQSAKAITAMPFIDNKLNKDWLRQVAADADTVYSKPYFRRDFVTAWYYIHKKDSTVCQVMKDSSEKVRQVIIEKKNVRTFFAQYYPNGQAIVIVGLDNDGRFQGAVQEFFPDGNLKAKGEYKDGLATGTWEHYDEEGKLTEKKEFNMNGQLIKSNRY